MAYQLFSRVALKEDLPAHGLQRGDVATVVETHSGEEHQEPGYSLEVFNAIGETIAVVTVTRITNRAACAWRGSSRTATG